MFLSILKDSVMLFLLIYAVFNLTEQLIHFFMRYPGKQNGQLRKFHVIDASNVLPEQLEYSLRCEMSNCKDAVFLLMDFPDPESDAITHALCKEFSGLHPITRGEFLKIISSPTALDAFQEVGITASPNPHK